MENIFKVIEVDIDCYGENIKVDTNNVYEGIEEDNDYALENTFEVDADEKILYPCEGAYKSLGEKCTMLKILQL